MSCRGATGIFLAAAFLFACKSSRVLTPVELKQQELVDLNATIHANGKELEARKVEQLTLPKGSPGHLNAGRRVALLMEKSSNLSLQFEGLKMELAEARRKEAEAAIAATNAPPVAPTTNAASTQPVLTRGDLNLYPFAFATDADQGTKMVTGEVENASTNALTDVSVAFTVFDADDQSVGTVSDQIATLAPGVRWAFKALVLDNTAVKAEFLEFNIAGNPVPPAAPTPGTTTTPPAPGSTP